jgi:hypothetical protein
MGVGFKTQTKPVFLPIVQHFEMSAAKSLFIRFDPGIRLH